MSKLFDLQGKDFVRGLFTAVLFSVITYLVQFLGIDGIDSVVISGFVTHIVNVFFSDEEGKLLGAI